MQHIPQLQHLPRAVAEVEVELLAAAQALIRSKGRTVSAGASTNLSVAAQAASTRLNSAPSSISQGG